MKRTLLPHGFTLIELLLAMVLSTTLLAALWSALSVHLRAFDTGRMEIEQSQLGRALVARIAADLECAITQPAAPPRPALGVPGVALAPAPLPMPFVTEAALGAGTEVGGLDERASLWGTSHQLRLRVFQPREEQPGGLPSGEIASGQFRPPGDLRIITYWLAELQAGEGSASTTLMPRGMALVRREEPWLAWREPATRAGAVTSSQGETVGDLAREQFQMSRLPETDPAVTDDNLLVIGEVAGLRFRYLDGGIWHDEWDSARRGHLPAAVELSLLVRGDEDEFVELPSGETRERPSYRAVIRLMAGGAAAPIRRPGQSVGAESAVSGQAAGSTAPAGSLPSKAAGSEYSR